MRVPAPENGEKRGKLTVWNGAADPPGGEDAGGGGGNRGEGGEGGRTVVVGVRMDAESRELLTWALVKVAEPGDRVVALHVLPNSTAGDRVNSASNPTSCSSLIDLIKSFDSVLAAYEGVCTLKQIDLKLKICRGSSLRKVLVREVKNFAATKLVLGVAKNGRAIGSSTSIAKYCAKKLLPQECSVLAVNNGKIVFEREAPPLSAVCFQPTAVEKTKDCGHIANLAHKIHHTTEKNFKLSNRSDANSDPSLALTGEGAKKDTSLSLSCDVDELNIHRGEDGSKLSLVSSESNCSVYASSPVYTEGDKRSQGLQSRKIKSMAMTRAGPSSLSLFVKDLSESRPGWPFLRKVILHDKKASSEKSKMSVVQWATRLPSRYSSSAVVHPDLKTSKSMANVRFNIDNNNGMIAPARHSASAAVYPDYKPSKSVANAISNPDSNSGVVVPLRNGASHQQDAVHHEELQKLPKELESLHLQYSSSCRLFSYQDLMNATTNFSADKLVGKGGSSRVYKGSLPDGKEIAVKILQQSKNVLKEFILEVEIITTLHHKNIISLLGFCFENHNFILVCDFLSRGSLEDNLHGNNNGQSLFGWIERYKVAMGLAEALDYLHGAGNAQPVIHRDVKSSNILLSDDYEPQLSDFGLATRASSTSSHITCCDVAGTFGYLAPEYFMYGKVNEMIDVYAFGVVLLELLTGRKPINTGLKGQESLVMWAKPILQSGTVAKLLDPSLGDTYDNDQVERMILAASLCIRKAPRSRPIMALVLKLLQGDEDIIKWAKLQINVSEEFDGLDDESANPTASIQSHLSLALLDVEDDSFSVSSTEIMSHSSLEDYLRGRWSRSSSFD